MSEPTGNEPMCSVFACGRYVGAVMHRGRMGFEAGDDVGEPGLFFNDRGGYSASLPSVVTLKATRALDGRN
jgi:hypothetical protein